MVKQEESELLSAYLDGRVSTAESNDIKKRLSASPEWRNELQKLQSSKLLLAALPRMEAPEDLVATLERQMRQHELQQSEKGWNWGAIRSLFDFQRRWVLAGTFASAMIALSVVGIQNWRQPAPLPFEPLLAAHTRGQQGSGFVQYVFSASSYSKQLKAVRNKNA